MHLKITATANFEVLEVNLIEEQIDFQKEQIKVGFKFLETCQKFGRFIIIIIHLKCAFCMDRKIIYSLSPKVTRYIRL